MIIKAGERLDNIGFGALKIVQMPKEFCYGIDAVILADFAAKISLGQGPKQKGKVERVMDLGSGSGIVPLILSHKTELSKIYALELQEDSVDRARRTVSLNDLDERIEVIQGDVITFFGSDNENLKGYFDLVSSNPPYVAMGSGIKNADTPKHIARQETTASLDDFIMAASIFLRSKGHFVMVHRPSRLAELIYSMKTHGIEPKTLRFVSPLPNKSPNILLIHGIKDGGRELDVMDPLIVYESPSIYSEEIQNIYER